MSAPPFDGTAYRRAVLGPLRDGDPGTVEDLFWLGGVPHDVDDGSEIEVRLRATKGFLHKEQGRARQAAVAAAVLREWPRVQRGLADPGVRAALRERRAADGGRQAPPGTGTGRAERGSGADAAEDPAVRRRRQVAAHLAELARLRGEPEIAEDLYAFLGLPPTATRVAVQERLEQVAAVARRRRPDRERTLLDELVVRARELLLVDDPAAYRAGLAIDGGGTDPGAGAPAGDAAGPREVEPRVAPGADGAASGSPPHAAWATASVPIRLHWAPGTTATPVVVRVERRPEGDVTRPLAVEPDGYEDRKVVAGRTYEYRVTPRGAQEPAILVVEAGAGGRVDPRPAHVTGTSAGGAPRDVPAGGDGPAGSGPGAAPGGIPVVEGTVAGRAADGALVLTWSWPSGVTEAYVAWGAAPPEAGGVGGRKVTNSRYEIDGGALLHGVPAGAHVAVFAGRRDGPALSWGRADAGSRILAP